LEQQTKNLLTANNETDHIKDKSPHIKKGKTERRKKGTALAQQFNQYLIN